MRALQIELIKLNRLANYIMLVLVILIVAGVAATSFYTLNKAHMQNGHFMLAQVWGIQSSIVDLILAVFIIMNIGKEFSDNTLRRAIIDGYTRDEFFQNKLLVFVMSVLLFFGIQKVILIAGGGMSGQSEAVKHYLTAQVLVTSFVKLLSVGIMAFFLVFLTRSIAISIVIYFVWNIVESLMVGLEKFVTNWNIELGNYLPLSSMDAVLNPGIAVHAQTILIAAGYLLIMLLVSYVLLLKRDIK